MTITNGKMRGGGRLDAPSRAGNPVRLQQIVRARVGMELNWNARCKSVPVLFAVAIHLARCSR